MVVIMYVYSFCLLHVINLWFIWFYIVILIAYSGY